MKPILRAFLVLALIVTGASGIGAQKIDDATRDRNRERLAQLLDQKGPAMHVSFSRSTKQPYNYIGYLTTGLANAEKFEIVFRVTDVDTYSLRVYPHYRGGYVNIDKARDPAALMRAVLRMSDRTFLFWGIDDDGDLFAGYTITLESGFPAEAIDVVLRSIVNHDKFFGEFLPSI